MNRLITRSCFGQQGLNDPFGFVVFAFIEMVVPDSTFFIDEIVRGPIFIVECLPDCQIARLLSTTTGYVISDSWTACRTFRNSFSKANSGECTPITTRPYLRYFSSHARI